MTGHDIRRYAATVGAALLVVNCSRAAKTGSDEEAAPRDTAPAAATAESTQAPAPRAAPRIHALVPDSAQVPRNSVVEILIRGSDFEPGTPGRNTVEMGPIRLALVPANPSGTEIRFVIPDRYTTNSEAPPRALMPGTYQVTVRTTVGASNAVPIRVLP